MKLKGAAEPTTRADAAALSAALAEALPEGAVAAKYRVPARSTGEAAKAYSNFLGIKGDFRPVDAALRECARLAAAQCSERAAAIELARTALASSVKHLQCRISCRCRLCSRLMGHVPLETPAEHAIVSFFMMWCDQLVTMQVRSRYIEMFNATLYVAHVLHEALTHLSAKHDAMRRGWDTLVEDLAATKAAAESEKERRVAVAEECEALREQFEEHREHADAEAAALRGQCDVRSSEEICCKSWTLQHGSRNVLVAAQSKMRLQMVQVHLRHVQPCAVRPANAYVIWTQAHQRYSCAQDLNERLAAEKRGFMKTVAAKDERAAAARAAAQADADAARDDREALEQRLKVSERQLARLLHSEVRIFGFAFARLVASLFPLGRRKFGCFASVPAPFCAN
jgi:peptide methionine sulfoxide reductase MsrB